MSKNYKRQTEEADLEDMVKDTVFSIFMFASTIGIGAAAHAFM